MNAYNPSSFVGLRGMAGGLGYYRLKLKLTLLNYFRICCRFSCLHIDQTLSLWYVGYSRKAGSSLSQKQHRTAD